MKLLNREPTEEMVVAAGGKLDVFQEMARFIWETAYDVAPEIKIDMEPDMSVKRNMAGQVIVEWKQGDVYDHRGKTFYSAEQLAALQAENERLRIESEELKNELSECSMVIDNIEPTNKMFATQLSKLTAERDELIAICREFVRRVECGEVRSKRTYKIMLTAIAKYEGEKYGGS